jgi:hypothetical protein
VPSLDPVWRPRADVGRCIELKEEVRMNAKTNHLTFTAEELAALEGVKTYISDTFGADARWTYEDRDGDAYGLLEAFGTTEDGQDWFPMVTVQLTSDPGARFALLEDARGPAWKTTDDIGQVVAELKATAGDVFAVL